MAYSPTTQNPKHPTTPIINDKTVKAYSIIPIGSFGYSIVEYLIQGDKVLHKVRDEESLKEIKAEKLIDILVTGRPLDNLVTN